MQQDEECPNCGMIVETTRWEDGECDHCGTTYIWEEYYSDEDDFDGDVIILWNS